MQMSAACLELAQNIKGKEALEVQFYRAGTESRGRAPRKEG
jgi:hypothetical protein